MMKQILASLLAAGAAVAPTYASPLDDLAVEAAKAGPIIWYESSPPDQIAKVTEVFNRRFPNLKIEHLRDTGGNSIAARVIQEAQAGGRTPDLATSGMSVANPLKKRNLLTQVDWATLGVDKGIPQSEDAVLTASGFYVFVYNKNAVKPTEAPKSWEDLLDPKWKGNLATWTRPMALVSLVPLWTQQKTDDYATKLVAQQPFFQQSTFTVAQQVASGEVPVGIGMYHTSQPALKKGAPIELVIPDPTPVSPIYSFVISKGKNQAGGKLLAAWLATPEGAKAYEDATGRGNEAVPGTQTFQLLANRKISRFALNEADAENEATTRLEKLIRRGRNG